MEHLDGSSSSLPASAWERQKVNQSTADTSPANSNSGRESPAYGGGASLQQTMSTAAESRGAAPETASETLSTDAGGRAAADHNLDTSREGEQQGWGADYGAERPEEMFGGSDDDSFGGEGGGGGYRSDSGDDPDSSFDLLAHCAGSPGDVKSERDGDSDSGSGGEQVIDGELNSIFDGHKKGMTGNMHRADSGEGGALSKHEGGGDVLGCGDDSNSSIEHFAGTAVPAAALPVAEGAARVTSRSPARIAARGARSPASTRATLSMGTRGAPSRSPVRNGESGNGPSRSPMRNKVRGGGGARSGMSMGGGTPRDTRTVAGNSKDKKQGLATPKGAVGIPTGTPLRRSPRIAAASASADSADGAAAAMAAGAIGGCPAAVAVDAGVKSAIRSGRKRAGPGAAAASLATGSMATPYSTRRARRASASFKPSTPGFENYSGADGLDSSFCTAIMGDGSPPDSSILNNSCNASASRRSPLFKETPDKSSLSNHHGVAAENSKHTVNTVTTDSEPTPTLPASLEVERYKNYTRAMDATAGGTDQAGRASSGGEGDVAGVPPTSHAADDDIAALEARMSTLNCGEDGAGREGVGQGPAAADSPQTAATAVAAGGGSIHTSASMVESLSYVFAASGGEGGGDPSPPQHLYPTEATPPKMSGNAPTASAATAVYNNQEFAPPSPAVGAPSAEPSFSPHMAVESCDESTPNAGVGGMRTNSTFGMSSFDDGDEDVAVMADAFAGGDSAADPGLPPPPGVTTTAASVPTPDQGASGGDSSGGVGGGDVAGSSGMAPPPLPLSPRRGNTSSVVSRVEAEARELAAAIVQEEESRMQIAEEGGMKTAPVESANTETTPVPALPDGTTPLSVGETSDVAGAGTGAPAAGVEARGDRIKTTTAVISTTFSSRRRSMAAAAAERSNRVGSDNLQSQRRSPRANGSIGFGRVNHVTRPGSPGRVGPNRTSNKPATVSAGTGGKIEAATGSANVPKSGLSPRKPNPVARGGAGGRSATPGVGSTTSSTAIRTSVAAAGGAERGRRMSSTAGGPVVARRQSMAFGAPIPATASAAAIAAGATSGAGGAGRASSRGRGRVSGRASIGGVGGTAGGVGGEKKSGTAAAKEGKPTPAASVGDGSDADGQVPAPAAVTTRATPAAVASTSHLLAPTASSQSRARPRSASPALSSSRGRSLSQGRGASASSLAAGSAAGGNRRTSTGQALQPQPQQSKQPRASSTGRRALTTPKTPNFRTTSRAKTEREQESTEEAEVRKLKEMQEHVKQMSRRNQVAMERSRRTAYSGNVRSSKPLTVPESPAMKTVGRLGGRVYAAVGSQVDQAGFSPTHPAKNDALAREHAAASAEDTHKGPTVPQPFRLSQSNRTVRGDAGGSDAAATAGDGAGGGDKMTFAERMNRLENKTPERFRTKPAGHQPQPAPTVTAPEEPAKPTLPLSPRFRTEARAATQVKAKIMTREEREEAELAEMKKHQFKARPFRPDGFGVGGENGVFRPKHSDKRLTQPAPFRLSTENRAEKRAPSPHRNRDDEELSKQFKARPMPSGRSSSVGRVRPGANVGQGAPDLRARPQTTVAASPMLSTKRRSVVRSSSTGEILTSEDAELEAAAAKQFKARPMPDYSRLGGQGLGRRQSVGGDQSVALTSPRPFNLRSEERGKVKQAMLAQRLEEKRKQEEAAKNVRARPLPAPSVGFMPAPCARPLTDTREFAFSSQARHERAQQQFRERVRREEDRARRATKVKALPLPPATFEPDPYPARTEISLTEPVEVSLHSTARAEGRAQWEIENQARLEAVEQQRQEEMEAAAAAEKAAVAELRRKPQEEGGMSFKAKPIQWTNSQPECPQLPTPPLTTPITPNLRTKRRAMNAMNREQQAPLA